MGVRNHCLDNLCYSNVQFYIVSLSKWKQVCSLPLTRVLALLVPESPRSCRKDPELQKWSLTRGTKMVLVRGQIPQPWGLKTFVCLGFGPWGRQSCHAPQDRKEGGLWLFPHQPLLQLPLFCCSRHPDFGCCLGCASAVALWDQEWHG